MTRCEWANGSELEQSYHDNEWGVAVHDDRSLFRVSDIGRCAGRAELVHHSKKAGGL